MIFRQVFAKKKSAVNCFYAFLDYLGGRAALRRLLFKGIFDLRSRQECGICRSRQALSNDECIAATAVDTAENKSCRPKTGSPCDESSSAGEEED